jgi:hypothetical protein
MDPRRTVITWTEIAYLSVPAATVDTEATGPER